jgi:dynein heavy chain
LAELKSKATFPKTKTIYDFYFNTTNNAFEDWSEIYKNFEIEQKLTYSEIMIPTNDSTRNTFLLKLLLSNNFHAAFPGPTGTGKSLNTYNLLTGGLSEDF